ncbi:nephrin isoform X1 [Anabrus simplex]|uniref:nephrin isoform X1 n=1 Tax=Anabrus simplex TaxID=316456 RepID=UPI0034DD789D
MSGLVGETVLLPCKVDTEECGLMHSIKWYRGSSRIYVFSDRSNIAHPEGEYTDRIVLKYSPNSTMSSLELKQLQVADEAVYKCEITYIEVREGCSVVQFINLTALIKPKYVKVTRGDGSVLQNASSIGPFNEGDELSLMCESGGGKPIPSVTWWNGTRKMDGEYTSESGGNSVGTGKNRIHATLGRGDLGARYECRADNAALTSPITSWVDIDVNVRPLKLELSGVSVHVVQGSIVTLLCQVTGARPAANITWYNDTVAYDDSEMNAERILTSTSAKPDGTFTTRSELRFTASLYENGRTLRCEGINAVMLSKEEKPLKESITLEVLYPPIVTISSANSENNVTVNETTDISLFCQYEANPMTLKRVRWYRNGQLLSLSPEESSPENPMVVIKNSSRYDQGVYTCELENEVGVGESSNAVYVSVYFKPKVKLVMDPPTPVSELDNLNITLMCKVESGNPDILLAVRWYLDGEMLKELPDCGNNTSSPDNTFCDIDPSKLLLEVVGRSFHGNYSCEGMNEAGWGPLSPDEELIVYYPPGPATLVYEPSRVVKRQSVTLSCSVDDPGRPETSTYRWIRGSHHIHDITTPNYTIDPVTLETQSNFTCLAYNEGGDGEPATVYIEVLVPPAFIERLPPYHGVLLSSQHINISCRVECSPKCEVQWLKNDKLLDTANGSLYTVQNVALPPDTSSNDFQSIRSTLVWNMSAWPGGQLDRIHDNANYTCQSTSNSVGAGVKSTTIFGVEYPPENITVTNKVVYVTENYVPEKVLCSARAYPEASYVWRREGHPQETFLKGNALILNYPLLRQNSGNYICEATNKHGSIAQKTFINVLYKPECGITQTEMDGKLVLTCTANANPPEVDFTWRIKNENDTIEENVEKKGHQSQLTLESYVENFRTYLCFANNSVGVSIPCERDVTGHVISWWKKFENDNFIIIIAVIVGAILMVIIVCITIIILCRRKRADDKYPNQSAIKDKSKQDLASSPSDGLLQPDGDKAFYENLPFHGMQSAPNKSQLQQHHHHHYNLTSQHHLLMNPTNTTQCGSTRRSNRTYLPPLRLEYQQPYYMTDPYVSDSIVYADLALAASVGRRDPHLPPHYRPQQAPTEYAILKFHDVGQEIDV